MREGTLKAGLTELGVAERDMTDEERKDFESNALQHEDEQPEPSGPASEREQASERAQPVTSQGVPNPD